MIDTSKIEEIVAGFTSGSDMFLVEVVNNPATNVIEVVIDSDTSVSIDSCVELGGLINAAFDRDVEDYELTVSSAGIGRPLKTPRQFAKTVGKEVEVVLKNGEKLEGLLKAASQGGITVEYKEKQEVEGKKRKQLVDICREFPFEDLKSVALYIKF